ncbi:response regulator transcription factor [Bosea sp. R86505]|uniref:response regulator transcription factor n=1 Tax=Bosea sp. R86505 TaxID=3101710 RepID=UPI0036731F52
MSILVVEDHPEIAANILDVLRQNGWICQHTTSVEDAVRLVDHEKFDVLVLDRILEDGDGLDALRRIRMQGNMVPALVLSALGEPSHKVEGLSYGADDYMEKPYSSAELVARVQVLLRRVAYREEVIRSGRLEILAESRSARYANHRLELTNREFELLLYLARNKGIAVSQDMIRQHVFNMPFDPGSGIVEVHIFRLRSELKRLGAPKDVIATERSVGYRFD